MYRFSRLERCHFLTNLSVDLLESRVCEADIVVAAVSCLVSGDCFFLVRDSLRAAYKSSDCYKNKYLALRSHQILNKFIVALKNSDPK